MGCYQVKDVPEEKKGILAHLHHAAVKMLRSQTIDGFAVLNPPSNPCGGLLLDSHTSIPETIHIHAGPAPFHATSLQGATSIKSLLFLKLYLSNYRYVSNLGVLRQLTAHEGVNLFYLFFL